MTAAGFEQNDIEWKRFEADYSDGRNCFWFGSLVIDTEKWSNSSQVLFVHVTHNITWKITARFYDKNNTLRSHWVEVTRTQTADAKPYALYWLKQILSREYGYNFSIPPMRWDKTSFWDNLPIREYFERYIVKS
jgi:hypothetical protein